MKSASAKSAKPGGGFIVTNSNVYINMPIRLKFKKNKKKFAIDGIIVRTGIIQNNPSEIAQSLSDYSGKGDKYLAVRFNNEIEGIEELKR